MDVNPFINKCFSNMFSLFMACLFISLMVSFKEQKLTNLVEVQLSTFFFYEYCFCFLSKNPLPMSRLQRLSHKFSSRSFVTLASILRYVIHLKLLFMISGRVKEGLLFHVGFQFSSTICWECLPFYMKLLWCHC